MTDQSVLPGSKNTERLRDQARNLFIRSFGANFFGPVIEKAHGATVTDVDGKEYLDFNSGQMCATLGHGHPRIVEAVKRSLERVMHIESTCLTPEVITLGQRLVDLLPGPPDREAALRRRLAATLASGVTGGLDTGAPTEMSLSLRRRLRDGDIAGPRYFTCGDFLTPTRGHPDPYGHLQMGTVGVTMPHKGFVPPADSPEQAREAVQILAKVGVEVGRSNLRRAINGELIVAMSTDAGNPFVFHEYATHRERGAFVRAGIDPVRTISAASLGSARVLRLQDRYGSVEVGKAAHLVILGADSTRDIVDAFRRMEAVTIDGRRVDLDALPLPNKSTQATTGGSEQ